MSRLTSRVLVAGLAGLGCNTPTSAEHSAPTTEHDAVLVEAQQVAPTPIDVGPPPELTVAVAGCHAMSSTPTCLRLPDKPDAPVKPLHLWLAGDAPDLVTVRLDGQLLSEEQRTIERDIEGIWIELRTPMPGKLEVGYQGHQPFVLGVELLSTTYADAYDLIKSFNPKAERPLRALSQQLVDPREVFLVDCTLTRIRPLELEALTTALEDLRVRAEAVEEIRCVGAVTATLLNELTNNQEFAEAETQLAYLRRHEQLDLQARIDAEYYSAILARDDGLLGHAHRGFAHAAELAEHIDAKRPLAAALIQHAEVLTRLGRRDEATPLAELAVALVGGDAFALEVRFNKAWIEVLRRAQDPSFPDPSPELLELITEFADDPDMLAFTRLNLAVAIIQTGDHTRAARELKKVDRKRLDDLRQLLSYQLTQFRVELAAGDRRSARTWLDRAASLEKAIHDREFGLELLEARADLELSEGNKQAALDAFEDADELAELLARQVPGSAGRSNFWTTLSRSRKRHVELAIETGKLERALCTVLGARTHHLRALATGLELEPESSEDTEYANVLRHARQQQRELEKRIKDGWDVIDTEQAGWDLETARARASIDELLERAMDLRERQPSAWSCADVRPSTPGSALLTAYPSADEASWLFFLDRGGEITWVRVEDDEDPNVLATRALEALASDAKLDGVTDLLVVPLGKLLAVNFQMLPRFADPGAPRVRHGLGLGNANAGSDWDESAAVISDGSTDLAELESELADVRESLGFDGWTVNEAWDPGADRPPRLLHYGGHAARAGQDGWDSYLGLPDGPMTSERILLERRAPALIVLSACDAGGVDTLMLDGGMNVMAAFLFAGAQLVIAADRKVGDTEAHEFAKELYAALPEHGQVDADALVAALTEVQRSKQRFGEWRAWVP